MTETPHSKTAISVQHRLPTVTEFLALRNETNWPLPDKHFVRTALGNSLFGVVLMNEGQGSAIGMGRVIGDGGLNIYIQDVVISHVHRQDGHGRTVINALIQKIGRRYRHNADMAVGLMAAKDQFGFYEQFGFTARPAENFGPGMTASVQTLLNTIKTA